MLGLLKRLCPFAQCHSMSDAVLLSFKGGLVVIVTRERRQIICANSLICKETVWVRPERRPNVHTVVVAVVVGPCSKEPFLWQYIEPIWVKGLSERQTDGDAKGLNSRPLAEMSICTSARIHQWTHMCWRQSDIPTD